MEEAARIRNEAPLEVRPSLAAMLVQEQIQYRMFDSWDWFGITAGTEFVCHPEPWCCCDLAVFGRTYSRSRLHVSPCA